MLRELARSYLTIVKDLTPAETDEPCTKETGLSRHTILRARRGERVYPRSLHRLRILGAVLRSDRDSGPVKAEHNL